MEPAPEAEQIMFSPNPTSHSLSVELPDVITGPVDLSIFSSDGKLVEKRKYNGKQLLSVEHLPDGSYIVVAKNDSVVFTGRFVKH